MKEKFLSNDDSSLNLLQYVSDFKDLLLKACESTRTNLKSAQRKIKHWYNVNAKERKFMPGDRVLALLPIPGKPLHARYYGPYTVNKMISDVNYFVNTPPRRKKTKTKKKKKKKQQHSIVMLTCLNNTSIGIALLLVLLVQSLRNKVK